MKKTRITNVCKVEVLGWSNLQNFYSLVYDFIVVSVDLINLYCILSLLYLGCTILDVLWYASDLIYSVTSVLHSNRLVLCRTGLHCGFDPKI